MTAGSTPRSDPILEVVDLRVSFAARGRTIRAVDGISFEVRRGETLAIVGESGCGKSTTGLAVMGLLHHQAGTEISGSIRLQRKHGEISDIVGLDDRALRRVRGNDVAMIFQEPMSSLNPIYTVGSQIGEALCQHARLSADAAWRRAEELLDELGIPNPKRCLASYPHQLSGGMRQRVMIAIALSCNPGLLIADEPTTALDVTIQAQILELLQRIQKRTGMAVVFITHNLGVVAEIADRAIVMYAGEVVETLPVSRLFDQARMPYTTALLQSIPRLGRNRGARGRLAVIAGGAPDLSAPPMGCSFHPRCQQQQIGRCNTEHPELERMDDDHQIRCLRWRELAAKVPA